MGRPKKAAPLGLLGERFVSEAARLPRDTCGDGVRDPTLISRETWGDGALHMRMASHSCVAYLWLTDAVQSFRAGESVNAAALTRETAAA